MNTDVTDEENDCQEMLKTHQVKVEFLEYNLLEEEEEGESKKQLEQDFEAMQKTLKGEKKELHDSRSELPKLHSELQRLQEAAEDHDVHNMTLEKLQRENLFLELEVSDLSQEYEQLSQLVAGQTESDQRLVITRRSCPELAAREKIWDNQLHNLGKEMKQLCVKLLESQKKTEKLEVEVKKSHEERQILRGENDQLRKGLLTLRHQFNSTTGTKREVGSAKKLPLKPQDPARDMGGECPFRDRLMQEQLKQDLQQLQQDFLRVQSLCSTFEKELSYERVKNLELIKHNTLLRQENTMMKARQKQTEEKLSDSSKKCALLTSRNEESHQKVRELELELLKHFQSLEKQTNLQEQLSEEKARAAEAENKHLHCEKHSQKLTEQQMALKKEKEALHKEFKHVLEQMDISVRKYHESQLHHKAKLQRTREAFLSEMKKRDSWIKELQNEVAVVKSQVKKDQVLMGRVTEENNCLLQEKRRLLEQLQEQEDANRSSKHVLFLARNRAEFLQNENKRLQERILQLTNQDLRHTDLLECQL